jgi:hypothetical protein
MISNLSGYILSTKAPPPSKHQIFFFIDFREMREVFYFVYCCRSDCRSRGRGVGRSIPGKPLLRSLTVLLGSISWSKFWMSFLGCINIVSFNCSKFNYICRVKNLLKIIIIQCWVAMPSYCREINTNRCPSCCQKC